MSALAAVLASAGPDSAAVARMLRAAPHRGTDLEVAVHGDWALGVANPSEPGAWREGSLAAGPRLAVAAVGALDDAEALSDELTRAGVEPTGLSPAALILAGWDAFGEHLPARLRGVFAAVVTDGRRAWCFRDHVGFRPLFYRADRSAAFVASEAKQVAAGAGLRREADLDVVERILFREVDNETPAALKGVMRLAKATLLHVAPGQLHRRAYWRPEDFLETARLTADDVAERFDELMTQAAARTLTGTGDVVSLSGGIDSPAVAAYAAPVHLRRYGERLPALATVYPNQPSVDESSLIRAVALQLELPLHTYERDAQPLRAGVEWLRILDGPIPYLLLSDAEDHYRRARELGFRNMLTGEIAELVVDMRRHLLGHLLLRGRLRSARRRLARERAGGRSLASLGAEVGGSLAPRWAEARYRRRRGAHWVSRYPPWLDWHRLRAGTARWATAARRRWLEEQTVSWMGPGLTMEAEEVCQSVMGVRTRRPWADVDLWQFFLSLPAEQKFPNRARKGLVRRLLRGKVPDEILDRRHKTVFDESLMARIEYDELRRWLVAPEHRFAGVDYDGLAAALEREDLDLTAYQWAKDLAIAHAFVALTEQ
ncbi:MAG TPA: asparagine synthase-related protein [Gaiellaceae bacterium]|nr:asparagine synthase-related protein [Gaiellaceae bacterium]